MRISPPSLLVVTPISLFLLISLSTLTPSRFSFRPPLKSIFYGPDPVRSKSTRSWTKQVDKRQVQNESAHSRSKQVDPRWERLNREKIAVCLVGGARRFELTGPSIIKNVFKVYPNSDMFLHSPLDQNAYKLSLLKIVPRVAGVRIFWPVKMDETEEQLRVLTARGSRHGIQGLLQYFNLVEGCLKMIKSHQHKHNFTYDWIVRTRVDGYWSGPLGPENFIPGQYIVPLGSSFGGLNDRLGIGDLNTSITALSRLSLIPKLDLAGFRKLNSEASFRAQLTTMEVPYNTITHPFCIISDRKYKFPPGRGGLIVASMSSRGPLSGVKCRPCTVACHGACVGEVMGKLKHGWSWTDWANGTLELCDAHRKWERDWEKVYDRTAGKRLAAARRAVMELTEKRCITDFEEMRQRTASWDAPDPAEICKSGLGQN